MKSQDLIENKKWPVDPVSLQRNDGSTLSNEQLNAWLKTLTQKDFDEWADEYENARNSQNRQGFEYSSGTKLNSDELKQRAKDLGWDLNKDIEFDDPEPAASGVRPSFKHTPHASLLDPNWSQPSGGLDMRDPEAIRRSHEARKQTQDYQSKSKFEKAGWDAITAKQISDAERYQSTIRNSGQGNTMSKQDISEAAKSKKEKVQEALEKINHLKSLISEAKKKMKGEDPCWKGYQMVGTKKKGNKEVPNCVPKNEDIEESGLQYYTGKKKYGKDGMAALAKAGRKGASEEELGKIKDKYKKVKENKKDLTGDGKNNFDDVQAARRIASGQDKKTAVKAAKSDKLSEKAKNPYAVGMAQAMKSTGDKPPLKKSTIKKAHDIAKKVKESSKEDDLPFTPDEKTTDKDQYGNTIKKKNVARHLARKGRAAAEQEAKKKKEKVKEGWDHDSLASRLFETLEVEHDHEASMARAQLMRIAEQAIELFKMIKEGDNLEGWVASKITKANDYINAVHQNLSYETPMEGGSGIDSEKASQGFKTSGKQGVKPTGDLAKYGMPMRLNTGSGRVPTAKLPGEMEESFNNEVDAELHRIANSDDEEMLYDAVEGLHGGAVADALMDMKEEIADELAAKGMNDIINDEDKMLELLMDKLVKEYGEGDIDQQNEVVDDFYSDDDYVSELRKNLEKAINS